MPPVIAPRRSLRPLVVATVAAAALAGGLSYLVRIWPAPEPFVVPRDRAAPATLFQIDHANGGVHGDSDLDFAFLGELVRHPGWQVTVERGYSGCVGDTFHDRLTVDADGDAVWTSSQQVPHAMHLSWRDLARLQVIAYLPGGPLPLRASDMGSPWGEIRWGTQDSPGVRSYESLATAQLDAFVDEVLDRYVGMLRDVRVTATISPRVALWRTGRSVSVTVEGSGRIELRSGLRHVAVTDLTNRQIVDAIDWVQGNGADPRRIPWELRLALDGATRAAGWPK